MEYIASCVTGKGAKTRTSRDVAPNFYMADGSVGPDHLVHKDGVLLLGVGNPLLDISCKVPMDVLEKYGVKSGDIILAEDRHATLYDELVAQYAPEYIATIEVSQLVADSVREPGCTGHQPPGSRTPPTNSQRLMPCDRNGERAYRAFGNARLPA